MEARHTPGRAPSAPADAGVEIAREMADQFGAPTIEHYRQVYAACGAAWPGDDEVRRHFPVTVSA